MIKQLKKNEKGATLVEYMLILGVVALLMTAINPLFNYFFVGDPADGNPGATVKLLDNHSMGLDDRSDGIIVYEGCDPSSTNVTTYQCDRLEEIASE